MPFILVYADDLVVVTVNEEKLIDILENVEGNLSESELTINYNKIIILIRDPLSEETLQTGEANKQETEIWQ